MTEAEQLDLLIRRTRDLPHQKAAQEVREYFRSLPAASARALAENPPEQLSALDGAPLQLRYDASRAILLAEQRRVRDVVEGGESTPEQRKRLDTVSEMLWPVRKGLDVDAAGNRIEVFGSRQFLSVDVEGQGRMIEVLGDLETAGNAVVLIPGLGNDLDGVRAQMDRAQQLKNQVGRNTAVVVWKDYDAPLTLEDAMSKEPARAALPRLSRFEAGIEVVKAPYAETTFIGNSYGSLVLGQALMEGVDGRLPDGVSPDRAVLVGCPGIDQRVTSGAQITPPGTKLYVARAKGDLISYLQEHGPDPADFPDVFRFETERGDVHVRGHMSYFELNSESFRNLGRIGRGELDAVTAAARTTAKQESRVLPGISWSEPLRRVAQTPAAVPLAKVFDGVMALKKISSGSKDQPLDGARDRRTGGGPARQPEGPAR